MYIPDVHDYTPEPTKVAVDFIGEGRKTQIKSVLEELINDEFDRLEEYADEYLSDVAARRAEAFLERVLNGHEDAAMQLLGDTTGGDRFRMQGRNEGKPWASVIHGKIFESGGMELRRRIVEAHADLLRTERIKDLESIIEGLRLQISEMQKERNRQWQSD